LKKTQTTNTSTTLSAGNQHFDYAQCRQPTLRLRSVQATNTSTTLSAGNQQPTLRLRSVQATNTSTTLSAGNQQPTLRLRSVQATNTSTTLSAGNQQPTLRLRSVQATNWFEYPVKAQPHHTDYAGVVWHGTYVTWLEEARVEYLRSQGVEFADLVALGCDLPVVGLSLRYHKPIRLGMSALLKARLKALDKVRLNWDYRLESLDGDELYLTAQVTLVPVDREKGKILRRLPTLLKEALAIPPNPPYQRGE